MGIYNLDGNPISAIGIGIEGSITLGPGINGGREYVFYLDGKDAGELWGYWKLGANVGLEGAVGSYAFAAAYLQDTKEITHESWFGWFYGLSGGWGAGGALFWSNEHSIEELYPYQMEDPVWLGAAYVGPSVVPVLEAAKFGGKWSATWYFESGANKVDEFK